MTRPCGNPHCRCHIANRYGYGWLFGGETETHGTRTRYVKGCRCDECRAAEARYNRERRAKARAS